MLWLLVILATLLTILRTHRELSGRNHDHFRANGAFLEKVKRPESLFLSPPQGLLFARVDQKSRGDWQCRQN